MPGINSLPTAEVRTEIIDKLSMFISAIETHPEWKPTPNPSLHHVWDFVQRTRYMMTELDNIEAGRPLQHPEQLPMKCNYSFLHRFIFSTMRERFAG